MRYKGTLWQLKWIHVFAPCVGAGTSARWLLLGVPPMSSAGACKRAFLPKPWLPCRHRRAMWRACALGVRVAQACSLLDHYLSQPRFRKYHMGTKALASMMPMA